MRASGSAQWYAFLFAWEPSRGLTLILADQVAEYMAYNLLTNYASNTEIKGFVDKYDFYIFPVVNPDGKRSSLPLLLSP